MLTVIVLFLLLYFRKGIQSNQFQFYCFSISSLKAKMVVVKSLMYTTYQLKICINPYLHK